MSPRFSALLINTAKMYLFHSYFLLYRLADILLRRGADPNEVLAVEGVAPMHIGTGLGEEAVKLLLAYGGDPNLRYCCANSEIVLKCQVLLKKIKFF